MKTLYTFTKFVCIAFLFIMCYSNTKAQVNGFVINDPLNPANHTAGLDFPLNISFNWANGTSNISVIIKYDPSIVTCNLSLTSTSMLSCVSTPTVTNINSTHAELKINISNPSSCTNLTSLSIPAYFHFNCPMICAATPIPNTFQATITDNTNSNFTSSVISNGIVPIDFSLIQFFYSYNPTTAEVTFKVYYQDNNCFKIINPSFLISLSPSGGTITAAYGSNFTYTISGNTITPSTTAYTQYNYDFLYYTVKLPCNTMNGTSLTSNISLIGQNCGTSGQTIKIGQSASYLIPLTPSVTPGVSLVSSSLSGPSRFRSTITNTGNTALNLTLTDLLPLVHVTSATQTTDQPGISNSIQYFNCTSVAGSVNIMNGNNASGGTPPANTTKFLYQINNLMPGFTTKLDIAYNLSSSCNGSAGPAPYENIVNLNYNCVPPAFSSNCLSCANGNGAGTASDTAIYNPKAFMQCYEFANDPQCHELGDTIHFCFKFKNIGDAPLQGGVLKLPLPNYLQFIPGSEQFTNFSSDRKSVV